MFLRGLVPYYLMLHLIFLYAQACFNSIMSGSSASNLCPMSASIEGTR